MLCVFHSADLDGACAGAIVKYKFPEASLVGMNYGQEFPWYRVQKGEEIYMVDFSLDMPGMEKLRKLTRGNLTWIDHHKTALTDAEKAGFNPEGLRRDGTAACTLTWEFLFSSKPLPRAVRLLGLYDVWQHAGVAGCLEFQYGMKQFNYHPSNQSLWAGFFDPNAQAKPNTEDVIEQGGYVLRYAQQEDKRFAKATSFALDFEGLKCVACNRLQTSSLMFQDLPGKEKYDALVTFGWINGSWTVSLYQNRPDVDVSEIAKKYGGGGHKGASGFQCDELPFKLS